MTAKPKFRVDLIEQAHRALDALPQHQPEEFTKAQAIQKLMGPIRAVQAKGYSLTAIAKVVSDIGIPITPGALRLYASGGKTAGPRRKARAKLTDKSRRRPSARTSSRGGSRGNARSSTQNVAPTKPAAPAPRPASDSRNVDLDWGPAAPSAKAATSRASSSRLASTFAPTRRTFEKGRGGQRAKGRPTQRPGRRRLGAPARRRAEVTAHAPYGRVPRGAHDGRHQRGRHHVARHSRRRPFLRTWTLGTRSGSHSTRARQGMRTAPYTFPSSTSSSTASVGPGTAAFEAQSCSERFDPAFGADHTLAAYATTKPFLTTREATAYCGFKTAGALRKAKLEGRIAPAGRRGGTGTLMWSREALDRYLLGNALATVPAGRARTPPEVNGGMHEDQAVGSEVEQLGGAATDSPRCLSAKGGRVSRSWASHRSEERSDAAGCPKPAGPQGARGGTPSPEGGARLDPQGREPANEQAARALCDLRRFLAERKG